METIVAVIALGIAIWQLHLQRLEIQKNGQISSLIHLASMLKDKINFHEQIIQNMKSKGEDWVGHAHRVNNELRPLLQKVNSELVSIIGGGKGTLNEVEVKQSLQIEQP